MDLPVEILKTHPDAQIPEYKTVGACAFDLSPVEDAVIQPGEIVRLRTGLVICVPEGYVLLVAARSSLPKKHGLCVPQGVGIVDNDAVVKVDFIVQCRRRGMSRVGFNKTPRRFQ